MNKTYPAIFTKESSGKYAVSFPDLDGCYTCGDSLDEAMENAAEASGLFLISALVDGESLPEPSKLEDVICDKNEVVTYVVADMNDTQDLRNKTLTIPAWLDEVAQRQKINFSAALRDALIRQIM